MANESLTPVAAGQSPWALSPLPAPAAKPVDPKGGNPAAPAQAPAAPAAPGDQTQVARPLNGQPPGPMGWEASPSAPLAPEGALLKRGSSGEEVATMQRALSAAGFPVEANGRMGPETVAAVKAFQAQMGLKVDGIAGPHTKSALEALRKGAMAQQAGNTPDGQKRQQEVANHLARIPADQAQSLRDRMKVQAEGAGMQLPAPDANATYPPESETRKRGKTGQLPGQTPGASPAQQAQAPDAPSGNPNVDRFLAEAKQFLGQPYRWGGGHGGTMSRPGPVDCSGLVQQAARRAGSNLDGTAALQQRKGQSVSMNNLKPGDLLFKGSPAHHVGIYLGNGQFMHAPRTGDVVKIQSMSTYRWTGARRVF